MQNNKSKNILQKIVEACPITFTLSLSHHMCMMWQMFVDICIIPFCKLIQKLISGKMRSEVKSCVFDVNGRSESMNTCKLMEIFLCKEENKWMSAKKLYDDTEWIFTSYFFIGRYNPFSVDLTRAQRSKKLCVFVCERRILSSWMLTCSNQEAERLRMAWRMLTLG